MMNAGKKLLQSCLICFWMKKPNFYFTFSEAHLSYPKPGAVLWQPQSSDERRVQWSSGFSRAEWCWRVWIGSFRPLQNRCSESCGSAALSGSKPYGSVPDQYQVLRKGGRLILRDYTSSDFIVWLMNHLELPLANLIGHGDVKICKVTEFIAMAEKSGFTVLTMEKQKGFRAHLVARKW